MGSGFRGRALRLVLLCALTCVASGAAAPSAVAGWQPGDATLLGVEFYLGNNADDPRWSGSLTCTPLDDGRVRVDFRGTWPSYEAPFDGPTTMSGTVMTRQTGRGANTTDVAISGELAVDAEHVDVSGTFSSSAGVAVIDCTATDPYILVQSYSAPYAVDYRGPTRDWSDSGIASIGLQYGCSTLEHCHEGERANASGRLGVQTASGPSRMWLDPFEKRVVAGSTDTVTAHVVTEEGGPVAGVPVYLTGEDTSTGEKAELGSCTTDAAGRCPLSYTGGAADARWRLSAYWDADLNGRQGWSERQGVAYRNWVLTLDADGDGVEDEVDDPAVAGGFLDFIYFAPPTSGRIVDAGPGITISDAPDGEGVRVVVADGVGSATLSVCGGYTLSVAAGSDLVITCGSVSLRVTKGAARVLVTDSASVTVPAGASATVGDVAADGSFTVTHLAGAPLTVTVSGAETVLRSGTQAVTGVTWEFKGFDAPVDGDGVLNAVRAGQVVPLKWRLLRNGVPYTTLTSAKVATTALTCPLSSPVDDIEQLASTATGLKHHGDGDYSINWATAKRDARTCKTLMLDLGAAGTYKALFKLG